ncbi:hypothetical protein D9757_000657 [Collybiopsis confluens]|uniref:Mitochondrial intermembrane space import and assembly protein 40 n=1 Tax=Collybiopsis confluens TaxID=2823264 RepID=A0A8H5I1T8_9AGAR|nr:hypothetical protein D9757_000657 [Collybiopsis confluens]
MFSQLRKAPLRRCLHSQAPKNLPKTKSYSLGFALTASATVISYSTWRWTREQRIALDSAPLAQSTNSPLLDGPPSASASSTEKVQVTTDSPTESDSASQSAEGSEGASQSAYDPVTGEINWDCPCLGGMAHGPCGPEFREAFACFVYSEEEPKGINCVERFQAMQTCFRAHPEVYADEIMDDDEEASKAPEGATAEADKATESEQSPSTSQNSASA